VTEAMLRYYIRKALGKDLFSAEVMISFPRESPQPNAVAVVFGGHKKPVRAHAYVVKEPILAAIGPAFPSRSARTQ